MELEKKPAEIIPSPNIIMAGPRVYPLPTVSTDGI